MGDKFSPQCSFLSNCKRNRQAITDWLAKYYMKEFRDQPNWPKEAMRRTFKRDLGLELKDVKLRVKRFAKIHTKVLHQTVQRPTELLSYHTRKKPRFILQGKSKSIVFPTSLCLMGSSSPT